MVAEGLKGKLCSPNGKSNLPGTWMLACPSPPCHPQDSPTNANFGQSAFHFILSNIKRKPRSPYEMGLFGPSNTHC